jgi:YHS domain-containing protein
MTTDPVCGMTIEESEAQFKSDYDGRTFYFCSDGCKEQFDADPEAFADNVVPSPPYYA